MPRPSRHLQRLAGKVAIVTGAGSQGDGVGTGKAMAYVFAREGARVALVDLDAERAEITRRMIAGDGGDAFVCAADVTEVDGCRRVVAATLERYGCLDVLVNNVGHGAGGGRLEALPDGLWQRVLDVNLKSAVLMTQQAITHLVASRGNVVNIASTAGLRAHGGAAYGPSKAAVVAFSRELAVMYGRDGVRANTIAPGHLFTPLVEQFIDAAGRERRRRIAPLGIEGDAWDVAAAALFLASEEARFITGACLPVDGGVGEVAALAALEMIAAEDDATAALTGDKS
ncbi:MULTISPECIES: SDR family NAD(P)-dependent oxidoreductase [unclassified Variovorax]|uniref:SDR family NAD(P)-dependent oxidoreductase n=1 Tax=unclassified Variovorax TaxID=663243 RepID=UPI003ECEAA66